MAAEAKVIPGLPAWHGGSRLNAYFVCDVFTSEPLQGNQLGVFVDGRPFTSEEMQRLAREMNFAETVFLLPPKAGGDVSMRIFTPGNELPFAGHPILGTAFVVASALGAEAVTLETGAGLVPVSLDREGDRIAFGRMRQPVPVGAVRGRAGAPRRPWSEFLPPAGRGLPERSFPRVRRARERAGGCRARA